MRKSKVDLKLTNGNTEKNKASIFCGLGQVHPRWDPFIRSAHSWGEWVRLQEDFPVCLNIKYSFAGLKDEEQILTELRDFGNYQRLQSILKSFEKRGKLSASRPYQVKNGSIKFQLFFRDFQSQNEYQKALIDHQVINPSKREELGYQVAYHVSKTHESLA